MNCAQAAGLIDAYMDGELDATQRSEVGAHLQSCGACGEQFERMRKISDAIHAHPLNYDASAELVGRVARAVAEEARRGEKREQRPRTPFWIWAGAAACLLLAAALVWNLRGNSAGGDLIAQELVSNHVRSLMGNHLMDVPSTDQHTVKPWFEGKLDFSPDVRDLSDEGFRLVGGRLDYAGGRPIAALVFQHKQHMVNLFTWPGGDEAKIAASPARNGYNSVHWSAGGMTYWVVADIPVPALEDFARIYSK